MGRDDSAELISRRVRFAACIALVSLAVFGVADARRTDVPVASLVVVKALQLAVAGGVIAAIGRGRTLRAAQAAAVAFMGGIVWTAAAAASIRGETTSVPIFITMASVASAAMLPWGTRAQTVTAVLFAGAALANFHCVGGLRQAFPQPLLPVLVALVVSVYSAYELERQRRERLRSERARAESEGRFRITADHAPVLIWMTDANARLVYGNRAWAAVLGETLDAGSLAARWSSAIHPDDRPAVRAAVTAAMREQRPFEVEYRIRDRHGAERWLLVRGTPRIVGRALEGYVGSGTDVTVLKDAAQALEGARMAALETARLKSEFLANMSHEIRTPMNGIFGMTEMAIETDDERERRECLQRARGCADALMTLLNDILDFSRIDAGKLEIAAIELSPHAVVESVLDTLALEAHRKGIELIGVVDPSVPAAVIGDPNRLRQVLLNLGSNAVKFTDHGEVVIQLDAIDDGSPADGIILRGRVRDTGIGIAPDKRHTIFEAFAQGDGSMTRRYGGSGLGLAIAQRLVELMGGAIDFASEPGQGSEFWFTVRAGSVEAPRATASPSDVDGLRVLVVDPNSTSRTALAFALDAAGCRTTAVASPDEAMVLADRRAALGDVFDVVVFDVHAGKAAGLAERLRGIGRDREPVWIGLAPLGVARHEAIDGVACLTVLPKPTKHRDVLQTLRSIPASRRQGGRGTARLASSA